MNVHFCSQSQKTLLCSQNDTRGSPNMLRMCNIEHTPAPEKLHYVVVKTRELTTKQISSVPCTTCGAEVGEACELHTGAPRTEPHRDRKLSAAEAIEAAEATTAVPAVEAKPARPERTLWLVPAAPTT
jgi:phage protein D